MMNGDDFEVRARAFAAYGLCAMVEEAAKAGEEEAWKRGPENGRAWSRVRAAAEDAAAKARSEADRRRLRPC